MVEKLHEVFIPGGFCLLIIHYGQKSHGSMVKKKKRDLLEFCQVLKLLNILTTLSMILEKTKERREDGMLNLKEC